MFGVEQIVEDGRVTVKVTGDIDLATAEKVGEALTAALGTASEVRADLSGVTFLDSTGIRALVQAYRLAQSQGGSFYIVGAKHWVAKVLDVTGVGPLLAAPDQAR
jgi:anti-sigma B factor antagonist